MKLASFVRSGRTGFGAVVNGGLVDLTSVLNLGVCCLHTAIRRDLLTMAADHVEGRAAELAIDDVDFLPVVVHPAKILAVGLNYESHRAETGRAAATHPTIFVRFGDSQVAHGRPIVRPACSQMLDYEGELAVVIGRGGRNIPEARALGHVAGYSCYNDATVRDWQRHTHQFTPGKNFPRTGGFGPWLVTTDEAGDVEAMTLTTRLNGEVVQNASLGDLIFPVPRLIAYCSQFTPLAPGDVILTGTPGGVGDRREPPRYLQPGEVVEVEITGLGKLVNPIAAETE